MKQLLIFIYLLIFQGPVFASCTEYLNSKGYYRNEFVGRKYELWHAIGPNNIKYWRDPRKYNNTDFIKCINPRFDELARIKGTHNKLEVVASHDNPFSTISVFNFRFNVYCDNKKIGRALRLSGPIEFVWVYDKSGRNWETWEATDSMQNKSKVSTISKCLPIDYVSSFRYGYPPNADFYYETSDYIKRKIPSAPGKYFHYLIFEKFFIKKGVTPNF